MKFATKVICSLVLVANAIALNSDAQSLKNDKNRFPYGRQAKVEYFTNGNVLRKEEPLNERVEVMEIRGNTAYLTIWNEYGLTSNSSPSSVFMPFDGHVTSFVTVDTQEPVMVLTFNGIPSSYSLTLKNVHVKKTGKVKAGERIAEAKDEEWSNVDRGEGDSLGCGIAFSCEFFSVSSQKPITRQVAFQLVQ